MWVCTVNVIWVVILRHKIPPHRIITRGNFLLLFSFYLHTTEFVVSTINKPRIIQLFQRSYKYWIIYKRVQKTPQRLRLYQGELVWNVQVMTCAVGLCRNTHYSNDIKPEHPTCVTSAQATLLIWYLQNPSVCVSAAQCWRSPVYAILRWFLNDGLGKLRFFLNNLLQQVTTSMVNFDQKPKVLVTYFRF